MAPPALPHAPPPPSRPFGLSRRDRAPDRRLAENGWHPERGAEIEAASTPLGPSRPGTAKNHARGIRQYREALELKASEDPAFFMKQYPDRPDSADLTAESFLVIGAPTPTQDIVEYCLNYCVSISCGHLDARPKLETIQKKWSTYIAAWSDLTHSEIPLWLRKHGHRYIDQTLVHVYQLKDKSKIKGFINGGVVKRLKEANWAVGRTTETKRNRLQTGAYMCAAESTGLRGGSLVQSTEARADGYRPETLCHGDVVYVLERNEDGKPSRVHLEFVAYAGKDPQTRGSGYDLLHDDVHADNGPMAFLELAIEDDALNVPPGTTLDQLLADKHWDQRTTPTMRIYCKARSALQPIMRKTESRHGTVVVSDTEPWDTQAIDYQLGQLSDAINLQYKGQPYRVTTHDFRRMVATELREGGASSHDIAFQLCHRNINMLRYYLPSTHRDVAGLVHGRPERLATIRRLRLATFTFDGARPTALPKAKLDILYGHPELSALISRSKQLDAEILSDHGSFSLAPSEIQAQRQHIYKQAYDIYRRGHYNLLKEHLEEQAVQTQRAQMIPDMETLRNTQSHMLDFLPEDGSEIEFSLGVFEKVTRERDLSTSQGIIDLCDDVEEDDAEDDAGDAVEVENARDNRRADVLGFDEQEVRALPDRIQLQGATVIDPAHPGVYHLSHMGTLDLIRLKLFDTNVDHVEFISLLLDLPIRMNLCEGFHLGLSPGPGDTCPTCGEALDVVCPAAGRPIDDVRNRIQHNRECAMKAAIRACLPQLLALYGASDAKMANGRFSCPIRGTVLPSVRCAVSAYDNLKNGLRAVKKHGHFICKCCNRRVPADIVSLRYHMARVCSVKVWIVAERLPLGQRLGLDAFWAYFSQNGGVPFDVKSMSYVVDPELRHKQCVAVLAQVQQAKTQQGLLGGYAPNSYLQTGSPPGGSAVQDDFYRPVEFASRQGVTHWGICLDCCWDESMPAAERLRQRDDQDQFAHQGFHVTNKLAAAIKADTLDAAEHSCPDPCCVAAGVCQNVPLLARLNHDVTIHGCRYRKEPEGRLAQVNKLETVHWTFADVDQLRALCGMVDDAGEEKKRIARERSAALRKAKKDGTWVRQRAVKGSGAAARVGESQDDSLAGTSKRPAGSFVDSKPAAKRSKKSHAGAPANDSSDDEDIVVDVKPRKRKVAVASESSSEEELFASVKPRGKKAAPNANATAGPGPRTLASRTAGMATQREKGTDDTAPIEISSDDDE